MHNNSNLKEKCDHKGFVNNENMVQIDCFREHFLMFSPTLLGHLTLTFI